ncbi:hypothetical protein Taro_008465 [Colocasia esculenta]|uniref:Uncharacterized protein n=1 Tax=Colocasia esculenta TaxID=4460 RepID=A0A843TYA3_COLES|nr:hypothetical protein [Colocasia esculenta]
MLVVPWFSVVSYCRARSTGRDSALSCCAVRSSDACQGGSACGGSVLVTVRRPVALRLLTRRGGPSCSGCRGLEALAGYPFPLSLFFFPSPSPSGEAPPPPLPFVRRRVVRGAVASWTLRGARRRWPTDVKGPSLRRRRPSRARPYRDAIGGRDKAVVPCLLVVTRFPDETRLLSRSHYPSRWYRDSHGGCGRTCVASEVSMAGLCVSVCPTAGFALRTFWWAMRLVASLCSLTEGDTFVVVSWQWCQEGRLSPCSPPRVCMLVWFVGGLGLKIPLVCLSAGVAMARRVATSEEASALSGATLSQCDWRSR